MTTIPNTVTNDELLDAMRTAVKPAPVLFDGKTLEELQVYLHKCGPDYINHFKNCAALVNKMHIVNELIKLHQFHEGMVKRLKECGDEYVDSIESWAKDEKQLKLMIHKLFGLYISDNDPYYKEAEIHTTMIGEMSDDSIEVVEHFGIEAPALLNNYSCAVEDALVNQVNKNNELMKELAALKGEPEPELLNTDIPKAEMAEKLIKAIANKN